MGKALPFKIVDRSGQNRYGVVVSSLEGLIEKAQEKFGVGSDLKIVLESDGTEVDDEEYFSTLEQNTCFMILKKNENSCSSSNVLVSTECSNDEMIKIQMEMEKVKDTLATMNNQLISTKKKLDNTTRKLKEYEDDINFIRARHYFVSKLEKKNMNWYAVQNSNIRNRIGFFIKQGNRVVHPRSMSALVNQNVNRS